MDVVNADIAGANICPYSRPVVEMTRACHSGQREESCIMTLGDNYLENAGSGFNSGLKSALQNIYSSK